MLAKSKVHDFIREVKSLVLVLGGQVLVLVLEP